MKLLGMNLQFSQAESWDEMKPHTLTKSWRKIWPELIKSAQSGSKQGTETSEIVNDPQNLHDIKGNDVDEWFINDDEDCETNEKMTTRSLSLFCKLINMETLKVMKNEPP